MVKIRVFKMFGREVARFESWEQTTVSDVVAAMLRQRRMADDDEEEQDEDEEVTELVPCICCGELCDPKAAEINRRFDSIVWESYRPDDEDG